MSTKPGVKPLTEYPTGHFLHPDNWIPIEEEQS